MYALAAPLQSALGQSACTANRRAVVTIFLDGGLHGPSLLVPRGTSSYFAAHPTLGITNSIPIDAIHGLHPLMTSFNTIRAQGQLALLYGAGYPNHSQSHLEARTFLGRTTESPLVSSGWMLRYGQHHCDAAEAPLLFAVGPGGAELTGGAFDVTTVDSTGRVGLPDSSALTEYDLAYRNEVIRLLRERGPVLLSEDAQRMNHAWDTMEAQSALLTTVLAGSQTLGPYPNTGLGRNLRIASQLLKSDVINVKHIMIRLGGFDTHAFQGTALPPLLTQLDQAVGVFWNDLSAVGRAEDVLISMRSEFGRTVENGSAGTDHGQGTTEVLIGTRVQGGVRSPAYTEADFTQPFVPVKFDFREVLEQILAQHLDVDPIPVLPEAFNRIGLQLFR